MQNPRDRFTDLLNNILIPQFCESKVSIFEPSGFRDNSNKLSDSDLTDFLRGWESKLLIHIGSGRYRATRSGASEQFFWSGSKSNSPRTFTIWIEPIITLAALARIHLDFLWPKELIGTQSKNDWAFDLVCFKSERATDEFIACEIKKSRKELDNLIAHMKILGKNPDIAGDQLSGPAKNAFKKIHALRVRKPAVFWAVGPDRYESVFRLHFDENNHVELVPTTVQSIAYR